MTESPLPRLGHAFAVLFLAGCALHPVATCPPGLAPKPAITAECREGRDSLDYVRRAADRFSGKLETRWPRQTHPGRLDVSIAFASDASIEAVCLRESRGEVVTRRAPQAVAALRAAGHAPACFADHRIEIQWESALVTEVELEVVLRRCGASSHSRRQPLGNCQRGCSIDEKLRLSEADEQVFECMLRFLPLAFTWQGGDRLVTFLPDGSTEPTPAHAYASTEQCSELADRETLVACMQANGWNEVDWHEQRHALLD